MFTKVEEARQRRALLNALLQEENGVIPAGGLEAIGEDGENPEAQRFAMYAFGTQFAEVRLNIDTGEVHIPRLLGVFAAGPIINAKTARSQFLGGMTMCWQPGACIFSIICS